MLTEANVAEGQWWRFEHYEIREGFIRPRSGARLVEYDPWHDYRAAVKNPGLRDVRGANRVYLTPYVSLVNAVRSAHMAPEHGHLAWHLEAGKEAMLLDWVNAHGLLGVLPHLAESVVLPLQKRGNRGTAIMWRRFDRGPLGAWVEGVSTDLGADDSDEGVETEKTLRVLSDGELVPEAVARRFMDSWPAFYHPGVIMRAPLRAFDEPAYSLDGQWEVSGDWEGFEPHHMRLLPFGEYWARFFPDVPATMTDAYLYPRPLSEAFWRQYAEPVGQLVSWARTLEVALLAMSSDPGRTFLHNLVSPMTPSVTGDEGGGYRKAWLAPSLICSLAMMALLDQTEGRNTHLCPCGRLFVSAAYQAEYCSQKCRSREQKRKVRARRRAAVDLALRGLTVDDIAARLDASAETIAGWLAAGGVSLGSGGRERRGDSDSAGAEHRASDARSAKLDDTGGGSHGN